MNKLFSFVGVFAALFMCGEVYPIHLLNSFSTLRPMRNLLEQPLYIM
jgi:hypothetical protein